MTIKAIETHYAEAIPQGSSREYARIHYAARKAISDRCENCGAQPVQAALRPKAHVEHLRIDPATGCRYSLRVDDYLPLCVPCHRRIDIVEPRLKCANGHEYTPESTRMKQGARVCRTCHREREAARSRDPQINAKKREQQRRYRANTPMTAEQKARKVELQRLRRAARFEHGEKP